MTGKAKIRSILAREILDSRGLPTLEVDVRLEDEAWGRASVPSGASTGQHEALELRDGDKHRYAGKGVQKAIENVHKILAPALIGLNPVAQQLIDEKLIALDASPAKSRLGANALLGVSMAVSRAGAASQKLPLYRHLRRTFKLADKEFCLPAPMMNIINGGKHADSGLDLQEFMIVPTSASSFAQALRIGAEIYYALKGLLSSENYSVAVGDEGGFAPHFKSHEEALEAITEAIAQAGYQGKVQLALDAAASEFYQGQKYRFESQEFSCEQMTRRYANWISKYPIVSIEDPLAEDDWPGWKALTQTLGDKVRIIGDDLFVTHPERLKRGIRELSANAILIKLNQIGTVTETVRVVSMAQKAKFTAVISHRSGETEDPYIADLAVALNTGAIKTGAPCRSERLAKYNQLLRIEEELRSQARYAGGRAFQLPDSVTVRA